MSDTWYARIERYDLADDPDEERAAKTVVFCGRLPQVQSKIASEMLDCGADDWLSVTLEAVQVD